MLRFRGAARSSWVAGDEHDRNVRHGTSYRPVAHHAGLERLRSTRAVIEHARRRVVRGVGCASSKQGRSYTPFVGATREPSPPWVGWDHDQLGTWPEPDDVEADLNAHVGPSWIEEAGRCVRQRLLRPSALPVVVGHGDWESQNLRWVEHQLHVVHDWDSVVGQREATVAGAASAVFTATGAPNTSPSVEQSETFLAAYAQARAQPWTQEERELAWAAGLWVRVFNAKKATLRPGGDTPSLSRLRLEAEVGERLRRAGA